MAIVQISRITHRSGLKENLPQLDGAELGWAVDAQELYIGNGTPDEGAPIIGNTRILTERDDLLEFSTSYVYKGDDGGYTVQTGPSENEDIERSLQKKLDDFASVRDFGALGDGVTDDTVAINRALFELFCRDLDPRVRRSLYFPAGVYRISDTILIPPFAKIVGEGAEGTIIQYKSDDSALVDAAARTCGNNQEIGPNISTSDITPRHIEISSLTFETKEDVSIFLADRVQNLKFSNVVFKGEKSTNNFSETISEQSALTFDSGTGLNTRVGDVVVDKCGFYNCNYGVRVFGAVEKIVKVTITNSEFDTLFSGIELEPSNTDSLFWPEGFRIASNTFDNVFARGINFSRTQYSVSVGNVFFDVGTELRTNFDPNDAVFPVVEIAQSNNISWGDIFKRKSNAIVDRVFISADARVIASESGDRIRLGQLSHESSRDALVPTDTSVANIATIDVTDYHTFDIRYRVTFPDQGARSGTLSIIKDFDGTTPIFRDEYQESGDTRDFYFVVEQQQSVLSSVVLDEINLKMSTNAAGPAGIFRYSLSRFD